MHRTELNAETGHLPLSTMKTRFNPFQTVEGSPPRSRAAEPQVINQKKSKARSAKPKQPKGAKRTSLSAEEALARAQSGLSLANYPAIYAGFKAKGLPESEIRPRENVFTFKAWIAQGRRVKKGEHGVKVISVIETPIKEEVDPETGQVTVTTKRRPWTSTVFHISQTESLAQGASASVSAHSRARAAETSAPTIETLTPSVEAEPAEQRFTADDTVISVSFAPPVAAEPVAVQQPVTALAGWRARLLARRAN